MENAYIQFGMNIQFIRQFTGNIQGINSWHCKIQNYISGLKFGILNAIRNELEIFRPLIQGSEKFRCIIPPLSLDCYPCAVAVGL